MGRDFNDAFTDVDVLNQINQLDFDQLDFGRLEPNFWEIYGREDVMEQLFERNQLDLLHHLPDPVSDKTYERLEKKNSRRLERQVEREERKAGLAPRRRLVGRRSRAERSPTLARVAAILCARGGAIRPLMNTGTAVSLCAFLLPSLAGTPTAIILTASLIVVKMQLDPFCAEWGAK